MRNTQVARALMRAVSAPQVRPRYIGAPQVRPRYIGAPVQQLPAQDMGERPIEYSNEGYSAGDVSYMGLGSTVIAAGATADVTVIPLRPITPQKIGFPSTVQGLLVNQISIGGVGLFASVAGVPVEMLSEVSTFPQLLWPTVTPSVGIVFTVFNPTPAPLTFQGAIYGAQVRI